MCTTFATFRETNLSGALYMKNGVFTWFYKKPLLFSSLLTLGLCLISFLALYLGSSIYESAEQEILESKLEVVKSKINRIRRSTNFEAFNLGIQLNDSGTLSNMDSIGKLVLARNPFISGIEIVSGGTITQVYPYERHKAALGLDIMALDHVREEALAAIENKKIVYAGPLILRQGGKAIIARLPIFRKGKFWGFSAIIIDWDSFLAELGFNQETDKFKITFAKYSASGEILDKWTSNELPFTHSVSYIYPSLGWKVTVAHSRSNAYVAILITLIVLCLIVSIGSGYLLYESLKKPQYLEALLRKKSNELLLQNTYFSSLVNALPDLIFILNKKGTILNFHSSNSYGLLDKPDVFIGRSIHDYFEKSLAKMIEAKVIYSIEKNEPTSHNYTLLIQGKKEYFEARIVRINGEQALVVVRIISDTVYTNLKLQQSESKYRKLVQQAPDCIFQTDADGKILSVNQAGINMSGYQPEDIIEKTVDNCFQLKNTDKKVLEYLKTSKLVAEEAIMIKKDGSKVHVEISATVNKDGSILGISRDITERKKYIDSITAQNEKLQEIAWIQSHKVRAPLTKLMSLVDFFQLQHNKEDFNMELFVENIKSSSIELDTIVREIVDKSELAIRGEEEKEK